MVQNVITYLKRNKIEIFYINIIRLTMSYECWRTFRRCLLNNNVRKNEKLKSNILLMIEQFYSSFQYYFKSSVDVRKIIRDELLLKFLIDVVMQFKIFKQRYILGKKHQQKIDITDDDIAKAKVIGGI